MLSSCSSPSRTPTARTNCTAKNRRQSHHTRPAVTGSTPTVTPTQRHLQSRRRPQGQRRFWKPGPIITLLACPTALERTPPPWKEKSQRLSSIANHHPNSHTTKTDASRYTSHSSNPIKSHHSLPLVRRLPSRANTHGHKPEEETQGRLITKSVGCVWGGVYRHGGWVVLLLEPGVDSSW